MTEPLTLVLEKIGKRLDVQYYYNPVVEEFKKKTKNYELENFETYISVLKRYPTFFNIPYLEEGIPCLRVESIDENGNINYECIDYIPEVIHNKFPLTHLEKNDMVMAVRGNTIGKVAIIPKSLKGSNISANLIRIKIKNINPLFLKHFLMSKYGQSQIERLASGALQFTITTDDIKSILVPKTSKTVQGQILKKINMYEKKSKTYYQEYTNKIKRFNEIIEEQMPQKIPNEVLDLFFKADNVNGRIDALFYSPNLKKIRESIKTSDYRELGEFIKFNPLETPKPSEVYNLIELEDIDEDFGEIKRYREVIQLNSSKTILKKGELIIPKLEPEKRKILIVNQDGLVGSSEFIRVKVDETKISTKFLWIILRSRYVTKQWKYQLTGSSRMRIDKEVLEKTLIPYPKKEVRDKLEEDIEELYIGAKSLLKEYKGNLDKSKEMFLEELFKSLETKK